MSHVFLSPAPQADPSAMYIQVALIVGLIAIMWLVMIRPQRKRQKREQELRNSVIVGDTVIMTSGVTGKVIAIKDDEVTIENGLSKTQLTFVKEAISRITVKSSEASDGTSTLSVDERKAQLQRNLEDKTAAKKAEREAARNAKDDKLDLL